jgi:hypothetical protein
MKHLALDDDGHPIASKYDPAEFLVAPTDSRGISYRLTFRSSPDLVRAVDQILAAHRFPLTSRGDLLRFALRECVRKLELMESVPSVSKRVDILSLILTEEQAHGEFLHVFDQLQRTITQYLADQAPDQAVRVIELARHQFELMPEGHWQTRYLKELESRFGTIVKEHGHPGVTLTKGHQ